MNLPTWVWYVVGAGIFIAGYLYLVKGKASTTTNSIGGNVVVPSTGDLANYQGSADILTQLLGQQHSEIQQLGSHPPSSTVSNK